MGVEPYCEIDPNADHQENSMNGNSHTESDEKPGNYEICQNDHGCEFQCNMIQGVPTCVCQEGYEIQDVISCIDIDECAEGNGGCEFGCINKPGTFQCKLPYFYVSLMKLP